MDEIPAEIRPFVSDGRAHRGTCPICERETWFVEHDPWLRDHYLCHRCGSIPRQRAMLDTLGRFVPGWRSLVVHESSPDGPSSDMIKANCASYTDSHRVAGQPRGQVCGGYRNEDLHALTFEDESFDVFLTQDVLEHVLHPDRALAEIARTLKPGGVHVFTIPWYPELPRSRARAREVDGRVEHLLEPDYHGKDGAKDYLVTWDWGPDLADLIYGWCGMTTTIYLHRDRNLGLDGALLETFVSRKAR